MQPISDDALFTYGVENTLSVSLLPLVHKTDKDLLLSFSCCVVSQIPGRVWTLLVIIVNKSSAVNPDS